jgi:SAM-dependent methyltransferase
VSERPRNWFDRGGDAYARYRPDYPDALALYLAARAPDRGRAVDVGCGNGQFTRLLADHFDDVLGVDPSADQVAHAGARDHVRYAVAPAEALPVENGSVALVAAAQAAHWFDLPRFYDEARRVSAPRGVVALISYGVMRLEPKLAERFAHFYEREIGPFWPPERRLVDEGYAGIAFPFAEERAPPFEIGRDWALAEVLGYVSTWSATARALEAGQAAMLERFVIDMTALWGDPEILRPVSWPVVMRIGRVD